MVSKVSKLKSLQQMAYELVQMGPMHSCVVSLWSGLWIALLMKFIFGWSMTPCGLVMSTDVSEEPTAYLGS